MTIPLVHLVDPDTGAETRKCSRCGVYKELDRFFPRLTRTGWYSQCKECRQGDRVKSRLMVEYGITPEIYDEMFISQGGSCKICGEHQLTQKKRLNVDHCHKTGKVRGLLCHKCNKALGLFKDSSEMLDIASQYLKGL